VEARSVMPLHSVGDGTMVVFFGVAVQWTTRWVMVLILRGLVCESS
jgi:hypothetical protein